jgi:hypothetical protein
MYIEISLNLGIDIKKRWVCKVLLFFIKEEY